MLPPYLVDCQWWDRCPDCAIKVRLRHERLSTICDDCADERRRRSR